MVVLVNTQNSWKSLEGHFHKISQGCSVAAECTGEVWRAASITPGRCTPLSISYASLLSAPHYYFQSNCSNSVVTHSPHLQVRRLRPNNLSWHIQVRPSESRRPGPNPASLDPRSFCVPRSGEQRSPGAEHIPFGHSQCCVLGAGKGRGGKIQLPGASGGSQGGGGVGVGAGRVTVAGLACGSNIRWAVRGDAEAHLPQGHWQVSICRAGAQSEGRTDPSPAPHCPSGSAPLRSPWEQAAQKAREGVWLPKGRQPPALPFLPTAPSCRASP